MRLVLPLFFFSAVVETSERASEKSAEGLRLQVTRWSSSDRSRLPIPPSTTAMDHMSSTELLHGEGEDGELERGARKTRRSHGRRLSNCRNASFSLSRGIPRKSDETVVRWRARAEALLRLRPLSFDAEASESMFSPAMR